MKYLIGLGVLVVILSGSVLLFSGPTSAPTPTAVETAPVNPAAEPEPATAPQGVRAPETVARPTPVPSAQDEWLWSLAADTRESLPVSVTENLTITDALFLPRMRIMEYTYVSTALDARDSALEMRDLIGARAEGLCLEGRDIFEMGVTLRNSFKDREGVLFQRVYLMPEDCQRFY